MLLAAENQVSPVPLIELFGAYLAYWVEILSEPGMFIDPMGTGRGYVCDDAIALVKMAFLRERGMLFTDGQPANVGPLADLLEAY